MNKHISLVSLLMLCLVALFSGTTQASFPTLMGPTGLIEVPTAETVGDRALRLTFSVTDEDVGEQLPLLNLTYGLSPWTEIGFGYHRLDPTAGDAGDGIALYAKYRFADETEANPALAGGVWFRDVDRFGEWLSVYGVVTKRLRTLGTLGSLHGHLIVSYQRRSNGETVDDFVPSLGLEYRHPAGTSAVLEYVFETDVTLEDYAIGIRQQLLPRLSGHLGFGKNSLFFVGLTYALGGF